MARANTHLWWDGLALNVGCSIAISNCPPLLTCCTFALPFESLSDIMVQIITFFFSATHSSISTKAFASIAVEVPLFDCEL
jgi:hypothetical protein